MMSVRINKYLSEIGYCSRRAADQLIQEGRVTVNNCIPEIGTKIQPSDIVCVDGIQVKQNSKSRVLIAFHKPAGIVCTTDQKREPNNVIDFINFPSRIFPIGRLDKPSTGLLLLTDDGDIVNKILRSRNNHEKEYVVTVDKAITRNFLNKMGQGVPILDTVTKPCKLSVIDDRTFQIILTQGLNRQIRRMCEYFGYNVLELKRIRIMNIQLDIPEGKWRELTIEETKSLENLIESSIKTID
jgi:23S rRNA pseudouridine2604 synthase